MKPSIMTYNRGALAEASGEGDGDGDNVPAAAPGPSTALSAGNWGWGRNETISYCEMKHTTADNFKAAKYFIVYIPATSPPLAIDFGHQA